MNFTMLSAILHNGALLLLLGLLYSLLPYRVKMPRVHQRLIAGGIIGIIGIAIMLTPWRMTAGVIFDVRTILLAVTGLFFGIIPTLVAVVITAIFRCWLGGAGMLMGIATIVTSAGIGVLWLRLRPFTARAVTVVELFLFALAVHGTMLLCTLLMPWTHIRHVLHVIALPVLLIYPFVTVLLCLLLRRQQQFQENTSALAESETRYRSLFEHNHAVVLLTDQDTGMIIDVNPAACAYYGWTRETLLRMHLDQINALTPQQITEERDRAHLQQRDYCLLQHRRADGAIRDVEVSSGPMCLQGRVLSYMVVHDVTEQRIMEETLVRKTEELNRHFTDAQRRLEFTQALREIDRAITASLNLRVILQVFVGQVIAQLGVDASAVLLFDAHRNVLEYAEGQGFRTQTLCHTRLQLGEGYAGKAAQQRHVITIENLQQERNSFTASPQLAHEGFIAYVAVPIIAKGEVKGVLELFHRSPLHPAHEWWDYCDALAGQVAIAIDNATLFEELRQANDELVLAYDTTLEGLSRALDLRDKETEGHSLRVTELAERLAQAMGVARDELVSIRRGALLHDIGKLGVPDSILLKAGPLSDEEWVIMRQHPLYAYQLLSTIPFLRSALDIPYCHHEKWNGTGYPRGLQESDIPQVARIFAVVDVWDALTTERVYRKEWSPSTAREYLVAQAGAHFDPTVVTAFLRMMDGHDSAS